jgi:hypothetical protein
LLNQPTPESLSTDPDSPIGGTRRLWTMGTSTPPLGTYQSVRGESTAIGCYSQFEMGTERHAPPHDHLSQLNTGVPQQDAEVFFLRVDCTHGSERIGLLDAGDYAILLSAVPSLSGHGGKATPKKSNPAIARFTEQVVASLKAAPIEAGMDHACDGRLDAAFRAPDADDAFRALADEVFSQKAGVPASDLLLCLSRHDRGAVEDRVALVKCALRSQDIALRDAGARAAESWGGRELMQVLAEHIEAEGWLQDYITDVIAELGE